MSGAATPSPRVSVVVPILQRVGDLAELHEAFATELRRSDGGFEFVFVVDAAQRPLIRMLREIRDASGEAISIVVLAKSFGEAAALTVGFKAARGEIIVTLAAYFQVEPEELGRALRLLREDEADLVVGRRYPRLGSGLNRLQSAFFHWIVRRVTATTFHDITGGFRVMRREVAESLHLYGDLYRFIPIIVQNLGFEVREIKVKQHTQDRPRRLYGPSVYMRRALDLLTVFFLVRFTRQPLRFFGAIGLVMLATGSAVTLYLGLYRILGLGGIADRPLLLLGILLLVLGVQSISIGLLGEIIIFTHARQIPEYRIAEVI